MPEQMQVKVIEGVQGQGQGEGEGQQQAPATWETWLAGQAEDVKGLYDEHVKGLKSALQSEREARAELAKQVKQLAKGATEGSEARKALDEMSARLEGLELQTSFYEEAQGQGVSNLRLAWVAAGSGEYVRKGKVDWAALKQDYPELFKTNVPAGNAGSGTGSVVPHKGGMNQYIRAAAGRG